MAAKSGITDSSIHSTLTMPMCNRENRAHTSNLQLSTRTGNHEY